VADEPDNVVLRLLREIRASQQTQDDTLAAHGGSLTRLEKRVEDLYKISTHTLGVAVTAHERYESLEERVDKLSNRLDRLEAKQ
jgi:polyhydroxyalkanoate synthesis regulator phasin